MRLAVDGTGRLAVVLQTQTESTAVQLSITLVDMGGSGKAAAAAGAGAAGGGSGGSLSSQSEVIVGNEAAVEPALERRGLRPLQQAPSEAQLRAAVPAVLWNGEAVRRRNTPAAAAWCWSRCCWAMLAALAAPVSAAQLLPLAHASRISSMLC